MVSYLLLATFLRTTLQAAAKPKPGAVQNLHFQFYRNPVEVLVGPSGKAEGLKVEITALKEGPDGQAVAVGTGGLAGWIGMGGTGV